jgi:hypothetical protein
MNKNKKINFSISIAIVGILSHFCCCILPVFLLLLNLVLETSFVFKLHIFNHDILDIILYLSGIFILFSFYLQIKYKEVSKNKKIILYITTLMYIISLIIHSSQI